MVFSPIISQQFPNSEHMVLLLPYLLCQPSQHEGDDLRGAEIQGLWDWAQVRDPTEESIRHIPKVGTDPGGIRSRQPKVASHTCEPPKSSQRL